MALCRALNPLSRAVQRANRPCFSYSRSLSAQAPKAEQSTPANSPQSQSKSQAQESGEQKRDAKGSEGQSFEQGQGEGGPVTWRGLALAGALGTMGLVYYSRERERRMKEIMSPKTIGKAAIGGPFNLIDEHGEPFTEKELLGQWTLLYFGFTMCPDICPAELTKLGEALEMLEKRGRTVSANKNEESPNITPLFISIDPERDSPQRSAEYARGFHPAFIGVSGSVEEVTSAAKKYRVYFSRDEQPGDDEYLVDHSIITYLMDPNGEFQEFYGKNASAAEISSRIEAKLYAWKKQKV